MVEYKNILKPYIYSPGIWCDKTVNGEMALQKCTKYYFKTNIIFKVRLF